MRLQNLAIESSIWSAVLCQMKGCWLRVVVLDRVVDGSFQSFGRAVDTAPQLAFCEPSKPAFHQVQL
jgi:hypothetical protein